MLRPCLIRWSSALLAVLPGSVLSGCERAASSARPEPTASAEPQQLSAPLLPRPHEDAGREELADTPGRAAARESVAAAAGAGQGAGDALERATAEAGAGLRARGAPAGAPSPTCVNGWITPGRGNPLRKAALDMIRSRKSERFVVEEMRYFRGPEDAEVIGPQREVERWYVKAYSQGRNGRRQRWLVRRAEVGPGIDAVAAFDSTGYAPGTWARPDASDDSVSDPFQRPCSHPPGGEKCMGLPYAVLGCLDGT